MKRIFIICLSTFIVLMFSSCENKNPSSNTKLNLALANALSGIDDKSFNQNTWEGMYRYILQRGLSKKNYTLATSHRPDEFVITLSHLADNNPDLIIAPGYYFVNPVAIVASKYPNQKFLLFDGINKKDKNVLSISFAVNEGSFLVGVCAGLKAKDMGWKKVGFLGGIDVEILHLFEAGFIAGVKAVDKSIKVDVEYANDFSNPAKGQKIASRMYDSGVHIIFNVSGSTGNGLIKEAKKRAISGKDVWVIGVDRDQYDDGLYDAKKSVILTSMLKKLDVATYKTIVSVEKKVFKGGHMVYALANDGVGLPTKNQNLKKEWLKIVNKYKKDIIDGKIIVPTKPKRICKS